MNLSKTPSLILSLCVGTGHFLCSLTAEEKLPKGEDVISAAAVGEGFCVHNLFQSHMVIQRDKPIRVWGWADPGENIQVEFAGTTAETQAGSSRAWEVTLPAQPANAVAQKMVIQGKETTLTLEDILVGDVWLLGGQSNMEHPLARVEDGDLEIVSAHTPGLRILTVPAQNGPELKPGFARLHEWSGWWGSHFRKGDWDVCSPEIVRELSAIGYSFARRIHAASQIPIGVIDASRGGTTVETWTPDAVLRSMDTAEVKQMLADWDAKVSEFDPQADLDNCIAKVRAQKKRLEKEGKPIPANLVEPTDLKPGPAVDQNRPGNCYASMIAPLAGFQIKGAIWHQGYNNALQENGHVLYAQVFPKMIAAWRAAFRDEQLPFGIISLCTAGSKQTPENYLEKMVDEGIFIRAVQYQTYDTLRKNGDTQIGFASSYDMRRSWYHPGLKIPVGDRIARWALATQYDQRVSWEPPRIIETKVVDGALQLHFDTVVGTEKEDPMEGFAIAGEDRRFQPARAEFLVTGVNERKQPIQDRKVLVLTSSLVPQPTQFRYAWGRNPMGNIKAVQTQAMTPLATQRSDSWLLMEAPLAETAGMEFRQARGAILQAFKKDDLRRRIAEAREFLGQHPE